MALTGSWTFPSPVSNRSLDTGSSQIFICRPGGQACPQRSREEGQELWDTAATRGPCMLAGEAGGAARWGGPLHSHRIWRYCLFHPDFEFSTSSQTASFSARRQLSLGDGSLLVPAPRSQQRHAGVHPVTVGTPVNPRAGALQQQPGVNWRCSSFFNSWTVAFFSLLQVGVSLQHIWERSPIFHKKELAVY